MPRYEARPVTVGSNPWDADNEVSVDTTPRLGGEYVDASSFLRNNVRRNYARVGAGKGIAYRLYVHLTDQQAKVLGTLAGRYLYAVWYAPDAQRYPTPEGFGR